MRIPCPHFDNTHLLMDQRQQSAECDFRNLSEGYKVNAYSHHPFVSQLITMASDENQETRFGTVPPSSGPPKRNCSALELGPRKKAYDFFVASLTSPLIIINAFRKRMDPLVHHGRHFGRTVFAFANVHALILAGLSCSDEPPETQQWVILTPTISCCLTIQRFLG